MSHLLIAHPSSHLPSPPLLPENLEDRATTASQILCVGGPSLTPGLGAELETRLRKRIGKYFELVECIDDPKGVDPRHLSWKGAAVISAEACCHHSWVTRKLWKKHGIHTLREHASYPF
jgi:actin-related protein